MSQLVHFVKSAVVSAALMACSMAAQATVVSSGSNNPLAFTWSFFSAAGELKGDGSINVTGGFNTNALSMTITLNNLSTLSSNRLVTFGFGIDPNATGVSFSDAGDTNGIIGAKLDNIPSLSAIEVCAYGGPNCSGGGGDGLFGAGGTPTSDTFNITLAGTWGDSVDIAPIGFKYQTGKGSYEFTSSSTSTSSGPATSSGPVPEPHSTGLAGIGLLLLGLSFLKRRRQRSA